MKTNELREMTAEDLKVKETDFIKELFMLKIQNASKQIENPIRIRHIRKDIARVKTILKEKALKG